MILVLVPELMTYHLAERWIYGWFIFSSVTLFIIFLNSGKYTIQTIPQ